MRAGGTLSNVGLGILVAVVAAAPLAAGAVHRWTMVVLLGAAGFFITAMSAGLSIQGRSFRAGTVVLVPLAFMLVPFLQSIPLPLSLRQHIDAHGSELLRDNLTAAVTFWPLSLDPPQTRANVGRAAVALIVFLGAFHLASGQTRRHLLTRTIAISGIAAVVVGFGHRIFGVSKLYGILNSTGRTLLNGPFVNANHTAEFLELSAFVCLACSFQRPTALNRVGWLIGAMLCAGGALATLSRGAVLALGISVLAFMALRYRATDAPGIGKRRVALAWGVLGLGGIVFAAAALGAGQLIDRFKTDAVSTDIRLQLWRDGLRVFAAHPFGIGRGAFDAVFPIYRTFKMAYPIRFAFIESEPLQLLVDCGWLFCLLLCVLMVVAGVRIIRHGRRDKVEAALVAGLFAVLVHGTFDFGLETLGVLVPFVAVLGTVFGRMRTTSDPLSSSPRAERALAAVALVGVAFGLLSIAHRSYDDFDALLKQSRDATERRAVLTRAQATHPLDYFYPLADARLLPLRGEPGSPSPRLHALNRALRLCPGCETTHVEVARNLWKMGLRRQSLLEWRTAVDIQPLVFSHMLAELFAAGARPEELTAVAATNANRMLEVASFLSAYDRLADAHSVLDQATRLDAPRGQVLLARAMLLMKESRWQEAAATVEAARGTGLQDPQLDLISSRLILAQKGPEAADEALAVLDRAATRFPWTLEVQVQRISLVFEYKKWKAAERSLEGLKLALYRSSGAATDANIWEARIEGELKHWNKALAQYRLALGDRPNDARLWIEYGRLAQSSGRDSTARQAYSEAARLSPNSPDIAAALRSLGAPDGLGASLRGVDGTTGE